MPNPLVSIITPVLNGERYIAECMYAVMHQSYPRLMHFIVDGGSTDRTTDVVARHSWGGSIVLRGDNKGVGRSVNFGLQAGIVGGADILAWIDSDDIYELGAVQAAVDYFSTHPEAMVAYGGCNIIDKDGKPYLEPVPNAENGHFIIHPFNEKEAIEHWAYMVFNATFYRRQVFEEVGYFNDLGNDLDMWLRINRRWPGGMHMIPQTLASWRYHQDSISLKRAPREEGIRFERLKQDFEIALKYGYDIMAPRPRRYLTAMKEGMKR